MGLCFVLLQDHLCGKEPGLSEDIQAMLHEFTALNKTENAKVALRARQVSLTFFADVFHTMMLSSQVLPDPCGFRSTAVSFTDGY